MILVVNHEDVLAARVCSEKCIVHYTQYIVSNDLKKGRIWYSASARAYPLSALS